MRDCGLSQRQRECLEGRLEHKTAKEIGRQLKISHNTVNMHLRLARLKLRDLESMEIQDARNGPVSMSVWNYVRQLDWVSSVAGAALLVAGFSTVILIADLLSLALVEQFSLSSASDAAASG